jgi:activating signal cointegrator complex subunit 1
MRPPQLTHFLMLPLLTPTSTPQLRSSLTAFKDKVTTTRTSENPDAVPAAAIRPLGTLHLTLGVMSLGTPEKVEKALEVLGSLDLNALLNKAGVGMSGSGGKEKEKEWQGLRVTLKGLETMHNPSATSILYAPPLSSPTLTSFCTSLRQAFLDAELMVPDTRPLLLHATVLNTVYVPGVRKGNGGHGKSKARMTINAQEMLEEYEEFVWMEGVKIERVAICRMGAQKVGGELGEKYEVVGSVKMP